MFSFRIVNLVALKMFKNEIAGIFADYGDILCHRGIEFYAAGSWAKLSDDWRNWLETRTLEEVISFVNSECQNTASDVPESLRKLKSLIESLQYNRKCVNDPEELWYKWNGSSDLKIFESEFGRVSSSNAFIRKRIKPKKQHEIDHIVELISQIQKYMVIKEDPVDSLVDIGAGVGHLSRIISLKNKLPVMAVEGNQQFTLAANSLDEQLIHNTEKQQRDGSSLETMPVRYTTFVTNELATRVDNFSTKSAILVGLHCCGDFSSTVLNIFRTSRKAKILVLLGCCYHKEFQCFHFLNPTTGNKEASENLKSSVFPLSRKWSGFELSYLQRELACHSNENMAERFNKEKIDISRYARAHLEKWIWKVSESSDDRCIGMCSVKCVEEETTFEEYIRKAMSKRGSHLLDRVLEIIPKTELSRYVSTLRSSQFDKFDVFRQIFAPAIESVIIDDRLELLREYGITAKCVPLFDPVISSRNLAIVAYEV